MNGPMQEDPQSPMNRAFSLAAVDACHLLRKWSDSDGKILPVRIGEFQEQLAQRFAEMYFGTHPRLPDNESTAKG